MGYTHLRSLGFPCEGNAPASESLDLGACNLGSPPLFSITWSPLILQILMELVSCPICQYHT